MLMMIRKIASLERRVKWLPPNQFELPHGAARLKK